MDCDMNPFGTSMRYKSYDGNEKAAHVEYDVPHYVSISFSSTAIHFFRFLRFLFARFAIKIFPKTCSFKQIHLP